MLLWNRGEIKTCESVVLLQMTPSFSDGGQVGWVVILELLKDVPNELRVATPWGPSSLWLCTLVG